ncbi:hypothetical protein HU200_038027 [Digitaria exilis]|uniref:Uncharacterized protein n=1 Tax=Digitaria exilis TaxID=1010633 RepID=A0A835EGW8_9POAL|nr:hypothetical protein HU200_038027 [Digitaria exilis]
MPTATPGSKKTKRPQQEDALTRVRHGKTEKKKASSRPPGEAAAAKQPVYLVVEHGVEEPTHSILELSAGAAARPVHHGNRAMSFAAVDTRQGPRIVGLGLDRTPIYDPKTSTELQGPRLVDSMVRPILIPHGSKLYALSRSPSVLPGRDFMPWFFVFDLNQRYSPGGSGWHDLPPPPVFPCRLNPLEYRDTPEVRVASYAVVGSHILLSVQQDKGTCAFDVDSKKWEMVDGKNLPFIGEAVPLGGHRFVARSRAGDGAAAVYHMEVFGPGTGKSGGRTELIITELPVKSKGIVLGQLLCSMGIGRFSSFDIRSVDPGSEAKLDKARIVHRSYFLVEGGDDADATANSVVITKQERQIYKLRDPFCHLAFPLPVVAALPM